MLLGIRIQVVFKVREMRFTLANEIPEYPT